MDRAQSTTTISKVASKKEFSTSKPRVPLAERQGKGGLSSTANNKARTKSHNFNLSQTQSSKDLKLPKLDLSSIGDNEQKREPSKGKTAATKTAASKPLTERRPLYEPKRNTMAQKGPTQPQTSNKFASTAARKRTNTMTSAKEMMGSAGAESGAKSNRSAASSTSIRKVGSVQSFGSGRPSAAGVKPSNKALTKSMSTMNVANKSKPSGGGNNTARDSSTSIKRVPAEASESSEKKSVPSYMRPTGVSKRRQAGTITETDAKSLGVRSGSMASSNNEQQNQIGKKFAQRVTRFFNKTKKPEPEAPSRPSKAMSRTFGAPSTSTATKSTMGAAKPGGPPKVTTKSTTRMTKGAEGTTAAGKSTASVNAKSTDRSVKQVKSTGRALSRKASVASNVSTNSKKMQGNAGSKALGTSLKFKVGNSIKSIMKSEPVKLGGKKQPAVEGTTSTKAEETESPTKQEEVEVTTKQAEAEAPTKLEEEKEEN